ncbi:MAG: hypothetical protein MMC33_008481 [Icmadophila ericetorum]|nr:hypothetical protein [Icmadophila ericetorum]
MLHCSTIPPPPPPISRFRYTPSGSLSTQQIIEAASYTTTPSRTPPLASFHDQSIRLISEAANRLGGIQNHRSGPSFEAIAEADRLLAVLQGQQRQRELGQHLAAGDLEECSKCSLKTTPPTSVTTNKATREGPGNYDQAIAMRETERKAANWGWDEDENGNRNGECNCSEELVAMREMCRWDAQDYRRKVQLEWMDRRHLF